MKWIHCFSTSQIRFYIYKLKRGDAIIQIPSLNKDKIMIILNGIIYHLQIFTNNEILPISILNKNQVIDNNHSYRNTKSYYKMIALEETYIISFRYQSLKYISTINTSLIPKLLNSYKITLYNHEIMRQILAHTYIKHRIIQFLLFLSIHYGIIKQNQIIIPFLITKSEIANIVGTNINTLNRSIKLLEYNNLIKYKTHNSLIINYYFFLLH